jgi:kynureninase
MGYGEAVAGGPLTRTHALDLDRADPLAGFRDRFEIGDHDRIYVDGNSLGRLSADARRAMEETVNEWSGRLVTGWHDWIDLPQAVGDLLGQTALGAGRGQVLACDSTTVNLYKLAGAVLAARPGAVVADADDFPTDRYVLEGLAAAGGRELRMLRSDPVAGVQADAVAAAAGGAALVVLSHVNYRSGALADMRAVTVAAQAAGALVLWDLCHSAGAVAVELDAAGADLAIGCTYKYLNAGPGSPAFLYVARRHQDELRSPIQGWFSQADQFAMGPGYRPVAGIGRFMAGTPPVLGLAAVRAGAALLGEAGIDAVERKAAELTALAIELHDRRLEPLGFSLGTPRDPARRGAHVSLRHPDAWRICRALVEHANVVPDFRHPDSIRIGLPPVYTRFVDVWDAFDRLVALMGAGTHLRMPATAARVT